MKILALDSSGLVASVAVLNDAAVLAEYTVNFRKTHSETLLPMIDAVLGMLGMDVSEVDAVALAGGPGSFTGLRIGSATAKGLALALDKPLIPVPTVDALAMNLQGATGNLIVPMMDARRNQVYTGLYRFDEERLITVRKQWAVSVEELTDLLNDMGKPVTVLGDGVPVYRELLEKNLRVPLSFAPPHLSLQRAAAVGVLASYYAEEGRFVSAADHVPDYLRLSQAERERLEKIRIRPMKEEDLPSIERIERESFSIPWSRQSFCDMLKRSESLFLAAQRDDAVIGYAGAVLAGGQGDVTNIAVAAAEREQGIGRKLLQTLLDTAEKKGTEEIFLEVRERNEPALALYRKSGFEPVGRRKQYYTDTNEDAILMKKLLKVGF